MANLNKIAHEIADIFASAEADSQIGAPMAFGNCVFFVVGREVFRATLTPEKSVTFRQYCEGDDFNPKVKNAKTSKR